MKNHYYKTKLKKMGKWALLPADSGSWHGQGTSDEFRKVFGFGKGLLAIHTNEDGMQHMYVPLNYVKKLYQYIKNLRNKELKGFEKKIREFYKLRVLARKEVSKLKVSDYSKLSNSDLANLYEQIRGWIHRVTIYDQFGWLSEEYWNKPMDAVLVGKLKLKKDSSPYYKALFTLTKPEEISTTLEEKRAVLRESILIKLRKKSLENSASFLAKKFGWMPVFAYGEPWDKPHYLKELSDLIKKNDKFLSIEYEKLKNYRQIRDLAIDQIVKEYSLGKKDLQVFIDFGLALDARNEAEYFLSFGTYFLLPIYKEAAKRLALSIKQVRLLEETEILACLREKKQAEELLQNRRKVIAWGFDEQMKKTIFFSGKEGEKLFEFVEKHSKSAVSDDAERGITASPGKVSGIARVTHTPEENYKIKEGNILITHATTVDYLPAMKKAVAFVTEIGGLTCHAAVVAREFNVPCIVSLKNATKNFKDGDRVEVDADKGIVRKIK